jgi:cytochrome c peroxidase
MTTMGRFIAVVIVLVAVALLIKNYMPKEDPQQAEPPAADAPDAEEAVVGPATEEPAAEESTTDEPEWDVSPVAQTEQAVKLGVDELLLGIPGEGELTAEQIDGWLADVKNYVVLKPELPLGLAAGAAEIKGIDKNPLTRAKIELGRQLYFDTRLSVDDTISCASCHDPDKGYARETQFGVGVEGQTGDRNSPVAYNRILSGPQFWDGRAESLEAQAVGPIANPIEMGNTHEACVETLRGIEGYSKQFEAVFDDGVTIDNVGRAIASFERAIVTQPAPWDYYEQLEGFEKAYADDIADLEELKEEDPELLDEYMALKQASDEHPISESAIRGGKLFFSDKAGCTACHLGANFSDEKYHNLGVGMDVEEPAHGRFAVSGNEVDHGAFKTTTVRNVSLTAPYMHDGSQKTLLEVVEWYAKGGHPNQYLSEKVKKLELTDQDKQDLVDFMAEGLLGELPKVERGRLP